MAWMDDKEWLDKFVPRWIDDDYCVSVEELNRNDWRSLPVCDFIGLMECEWIADAAITTGVTQLTGVAFEHECPSDVQIVEPNRDSIKSFIFKNSYRYAMLTTVDQRFLVFKNEDNQFYLICGRPAFVANAYRCSWETAKMMFFDYCSDWDDVGQERFAKLWNKYGERIEC